MIFTKGGSQFGVNYLVLSGDMNGNRILEEGETFRVSVPLQPPNVIYPNERFTMAIKTPPSPQVLVSATAPPNLATSPVTLARASS